MGYDTFQDLSEFIGIDIRYKGEYVKGVLKGNEKLQNIIKNHNFKPQACTTDERRSEHRMQSGMAFGIDGWNDN